MKAEKTMRRATAVGEWLALGIMAAALGACGGGGNGGVKVKPASPPPPPPPTQPTDQPPIDAQLSLTNTYAAHAAGFTGTGSTIGVVDSGIMASNPAVAGRVKAELIYVDPSQNNVNIDDVVGHGTWVSEIAAGTAFDQFPGGIAPGADLVSARIISDKAPDDNGSAPPATVTAQDAQFFGQVNSDLITYGVNIMNNSWGGITWDTTSASVNQAFDQAYQPFVIQHGGLVVFAAGNDSDPNPSTIAALPSVAPDLERGWLTVVAINSNHPTEIESYSNQCGIAMDYCLAAPGDVIVLDKDTTAATTNPTYYIVEGTSLAAPIVSGAAAVVWQAFPYFTNDNVRQTLLGTADDLGAPGPDPVFGYGEVDVGKAINGPAKFDWGNFSVTLPTGTTSTWGNDISGAGGLLLNGRGTLTLAGNDTYTGGTQILGGTLKTTYRLPGDVNVGTAGTLDSDSAPSATGSLTNAGTVVVRQESGEVDGDYTQTSTGTLSIDLGALLAVNGTAQIDGTLNVLGAIDGYVSNDHTPVLTAAGGVNGTFAQLTTSPGVFLNTTVQYTSTSAWLDTTTLDITVAATAMGIADPASVGAARRVQLGFDAIDAAGGNVGHGILTGAGAIQHAATAAVAHSTLQSLSGQLHAASAAMLFNNIDANGDALSGRFDDLLAGRAQPGVWVGNLGWNGNLQRSGYSGATFQSSGSMVGADFRLGQHGLLGYAVAQSQGFGQLDAAWDHDRTYMSNVAAYGAVAHGPWYAAAQIGQGWYREDMQRLLQLGGLSLPVGTALDGRYVAGSLEGGRQFHLGSLEVTPFADVRYQRLAQGGFAEQGGLGFGLRADARTVGRLQGGFGVRAVSGWRLGNGMWMQFDGSADWQHALHQFGGAFEASFTGFNDWLPIDGIGLSQDTTTLRAGLSLWPTRAFGLRLGYAAAQGQRQHADSWMLQGAVRF